MEKDRPEKTMKRKIAKGRVGEEIVAKIIGGEITPHTAPFDVVDFTAGVAYEVKAMSALSKDLKIHIAKDSMARKRRFMKKYKVRGVLIAVVIHNANKVDVYSGTLKNSVRVHQMKRIA